MLILGSPNTESYCTCGILVNVAAYRIGDLVTSQGEYYLDQASLCILLKIHMTWVNPLDTRDPISR